MANISERIYTIPLRDAWKKERVRRSKKAITLVREFLQRHMKAEKVLIGKSINEGVWERGAKKPPRRVRVHTVKEDDVVYAELVGIDIKTPTAEEKKEREKKEEGKREKVKKAREERKQMSIQEEVDESGREAEKIEAAEEASTEASKQKGKPSKKSSDTAASEASKK